MSPAAAAAAAEQALSTLWRNQLRMQRQAQEHLPAPVEDHGGGLSALELLGPGAVSEPDQPEVRPETAPSGRGRGRGKAKAAAPPAAAPAAARQPKKPRGRPAAAAAAAPLQTSDAEDDLSDPMSSDSDADADAGRFEPLSEDDDAATRARREEERRQHIAINAAMARDVARELNREDDKRVAVSASAAAQKPVKRAGRDADAVAEAPPQKPKAAPKAARAKKPPPKAQAAMRAAAAAVAANADSDEDDGPSNAAFSGQLLHDAETVDTLEERHSVLKVATSVVEDLVPLGKGPVGLNARADRINGLLTHPNKPWKAADPMPVDRQVRKLLCVDASRRPDPRGIAVERSMALSKAVGTPGVAEAMRVREALGNRRWLPPQPPPPDPVPRTKEDKKAAKGQPSARVRELTQQRVALKQSMAEAAQTVRTERLAAFHRSVALRAAAAQPAAAAAR